MQQTYTILFKVDTDNLF